MKQKADLPDEFSVHRNGVNEPGDGEMVVPGIVSANCGLRILYRPRGF